MYDIIGDIHGHAGELVDLLEDKLGYTREREFYSHPERKGVYNSYSRSEGETSRQINDARLSLTPLRVGNSVVSHEF